jgi:arylamine N-acetyltransferase
MNTNQLSWVDTYLDYIRTPVKRPSNEYLTEICTAHLNTIPFENISTLLQYREYPRTGQYIPDEESFVRQLVEQHMGGTCYAINSNLGSLLQQLGFHCRYMKLGGIHLGLLVRFPDTNEEVYVDCGTGAPLFRPLRFETVPGDMASFGGIKVSIHPAEEPGIYTFYRYVDETLIEKTLWSFDTNKTYHFHDFTDPVESYFQPGELFMSTLRCQMWQQEKQRSLSLVNDQLNIRDVSGKVEKHRLKSVKDVREVINEEFNLPLLPVEEAISMLKNLGANIFQEPDEKHRVDLG